ncbi:hypothetical protein BN946_scf184823.g9 [Trametes cinnabarina]|uniref:VHS domain-containing protein n=1 Tax=Pycnoporus cinnabarinus TaxID=5643 RepID=A0A060SM41_PYCCI|nr:hypothetical protein BN946_scf184823.g9 [Trametes cinnabarina]
MKKLFGRDKPKSAKNNHDGPIENLAHPPQRHDRLHPLPDDQWDLISETDPPLQPLRPSTVTASQTSSLASIHQANPPTPSPLPRSASPYTVPATPPQQHAKPNGNHKERDQQLLRKRPHAPAANSFAAVGILRALEPHLEPVISHDPSEDGFTDVSVREEKKEKRGFWERASHRERDKDKDRAKEREKDRDKERDRDRERERDRNREKDRDRKEEDAPAELTRMIGYLTATASEDWSLVLEVCDRASSNDATAKEAAKALRREFKYAEPAAQLSAARLWAIMLRNCSSRFVYYCESRKFLDTLEDVLGSPRTSPVVRERLLEILAAAAYNSSTDGGFKSLWKKVKPREKPEEGMPFDNDDAMFYPATPRHSAGPNTLQPPVLDPRPQPPSRPHSQPRVHHDQQGATPQRPPPTATLEKTRPSRNRVIPPEEDIRRLFQECKVGQGNASLLAEALLYAKPEDLKSKDIIKEFYARCRASQELISAQIPWAAAQAEKSREGRARADPKAKEGRHSVERERAPSSPKKEKPDTEHLTTEEKLLAAILKANEELLEALRQYDDLERVGIERDAQERSKKEIRMDRSRLQYDESEHSYYLDPCQANDSGAGASSSRSPSPSPSASPSPAPSLVITPTPSSLAQSHPLPPTPHQPPVAAANHSHPIAQHGSIASLAPPRPAAPHGPRSPTHRSNTPSPERLPTVHRLPRTSFESTQSAARQQQASKPSRESSEEWSDLEQEAKTPVRPSAKALGKRKVVDPPAEDDHESDSEDARAKNPWHRPIHYVYDAAAERTAQRIREGRLAAAALIGGVH